MASNQHEHNSWWSFIYKSEELARKWIPIIEAARKKNTPKGGYKQSVSKLMLMDYDQIFALEPEPQIIPAGFENSEGDEITLDDIKKQMFQMSNGDLNFVAQCECGALRGNYHLNSTCPKCGTKVRSAFADEVDFGGWLEIPNEPPPFLHPVVYRSLKKWMGKLFKQNIYLIDAILNPEIDLPEEYSGVLGRGMGYLATGTNLIDTINYVANVKKGQKTEDYKKILEMIEEYKYCLFVRHIPILNQSLHVMTQTGTMTYNDESSEFIFSTYLELSATIYAQRHRPDIKPEYLQLRVWNIYSSWMQYVDSIIDPKISGKTGFIRKNMLGARMHASARAVIAPITRNHEADEIEIPWRMICGVMKMEILNILENRYGKDINEAITMWCNSLVTYDSVIDSCLRTLHEECPFKGFPFLMGRNPKQNWAPTWKHVA